MNGSDPQGFVADPRIREYPGTYIRDWIMLCRELPDAAYRAYSIIRAHIWEKDEHREVVLTQAQIAEMISKSEDRTRKILKPLLKVGLLAVAEKREWWEYNPKLKRQERRTMNIYAVRDFPAEDYDGPKSISDFRARFAGAAKPDRSKTTGRSADHVPAGQADRSEKTGRSSPQVSDVSAGQADRSKTTSPQVENDRPYKKPFQEGREEEGDAHAGASPNVPSAGDEPVWGVAGGAGIVMPTLASANLIRDIAGRVLLPGEGLTAEEHQRLASLVEAVRPIVEAQKGLSWEEYEAWLHQGWVRPNGQRTFKVLSGALGWRLQPEQVKQYAWPWACERRGAQEASEARGEREAPSGGNGSEIHATTCGRHGTRTLDGQCLRCEEENAAEDRRFAEASQPSNEGFEEYDEPTPEEIDPKLLEEIHSSFEKADQKPAAPGNPWGSLGAARAHTYAASMREELARQKAERKAQKKQGRGEAPLGEVLREAGWEKAPHDAAW